MTVAVTPATEDDIATIADLIEEIELHYGSEVADDRNIRVTQVKTLLFGDSPVARVLLARDEDQVVGMAAYSFLWPASGATHSLYLKELFVRAEARRGGVARVLMRHVCETAAANGCSRVEWTTDRDSLDAQGFYLALGVPVHEGKLFYRLDVEKFSSI